MKTIYGIKNCDTMKKAMRWLEDNGVAFTFHDYRKDGLDPALLEKIEKLAGWENLLNKRGTTWRKLDEATKSQIDRDSIMQLMIQQPALIKRPLLIEGKKFLLGFKPEEYQRFTEKS
ncbi:MAG: ArsC family reductase [Gammaproteobacteria bacterium]|nr:ArsC family reductase [Gammaproteobacteria bacterium]